MSRINQIQTGILGLSGGAFQKLADAYLGKKGYNQINTLGSVVGKDKTRSGTPDSLTKLPNGKYIFAEYTTQSEHVFEKLKEDLEKCLDESKTGVRVECIEELIFCITVTLKPNEKDALEEITKKHGIKLTFFEIDGISFDLYLKYPGLARDFLGVAVDTGQILTLGEFVEEHKKNKFATPLDTVFQFRETEIAGAARLLESTDLVIISGRAGVGKTRLALRSCENFRTAHPEYEIRCIYNRDIDLFEDLRVSFSEEGHFLVLVDDANRLSGFDHVVDLVRSHRTDQDIKVIATARDYAVDLIREKARSLGRTSLITLQPLEDEQIKLILENEYGIKNPLFLERISSISHGNPRLAIMAAEVVKKNGTLYSINDVSALYDEYFASIRKDLEVLNEQDSIKVSGIIAFLRIIDHSNKEFMDFIERAFDTSADTMWRTVRQLHEAEVLDVFEDEVARISDQVLATYLFYLAFFKKRLLNFGVLLSHFFPKFRERLIDAINPVLSAFDSGAIIREMTPHIDTAWKEMLEAEDENGLLHLMEVFWYLKKTDTLIYADSRIKELKALPVDIDGIELKAGPEIPSPSLLGILGSFKDADAASFRIALNLILDYFAKRPQDSGQVLYLLTDRFSFSHHSYAQGFRVQTSVIDVLWERSKEGTDLLFSKVFIKVGDKYLRLRGDTTEYAGGHKFSMITFRLPATPELITLRESILKRLLSLYRVDNLKVDVFEVISNYVSLGYEEGDRAILEKDSGVLLKFLDSELNPNDYRCCSLVQQYIDLLQDHDLQTKDEFRHRFHNRAYATSKLLLIDREEKKTLGLGYQEYLEIRVAKIKEHFATYAFEDYTAFFKDCMVVHREIKNSHLDYQFNMGITEVLLALFNRDLELFARVLRHYLDQGDLLRINPVPIVKILVEKVGALRTREIIEQPDYGTKRIWLFAYFLVLPPEQVTREDVEQLYGIYRSAEPTELPHDWDYLTKYRIHDKRIIPKIADIVLGKVTGTKYCVHAISMLFNPYSSVNKVLGDYFAEDLDILKKVYFAVNETDRMEDYDGHTFAQIMETDQNFILEYFEHTHKGKDWRNRSDDNRDYLFIWNRTDYEKTMTQVVDYVYDKERGTPLFLDSDLKNFFLPSRNCKVNAEIMGKQDGFLKQIIERRSMEFDLMRMLFSVIAGFAPERRRQFIAAFLEKNKNLEDFKRLPFEPSTRGWSGSEVPILQEEKDYLESLLPLLNTADELPHKQWVERRIEAIHKSIQRARKSDFMDD